MIVSFLVVTLKMYIKKKNTLHCTEVPAIEDVQGLKSLAPPPTDQTTGSIWLKFCMETPLWGILRGIEGIFEFRPGSRDTGPVLDRGVGPFGQKKSTKLFLFKSIFF